MMLHSTGILANEVRLHLPHGLGAGFGPALDNRLAQTDKPRIGMHSEEEPARLHQESLELGDLDRVTIGHRRCRGSLGEHCPACDTGGRPLQD